MQSKIIKLNKVHFKMDAAEDTLTQTILFFLTDALRVMKINSLKQNLFLVFQSLAHRD